MADEVQVGVLRPRKLGVANRPLGRRRRPGEGSVYPLPNGRWRASLEVTERDGRRRQLTAKAATKEEAEERLQELRKKALGR